MQLSLLKPGMSGIIEKVGGEGSLRRHLLDMGLTPGTKVFVRKTAPLGDPVELCLRGYELTVRLSEAGHISVRDVEDPYSVSGCTSCSSCKSCTSCSSNANQENKK